MICSMTGFARTAEQTASGHLVCEIRSINHRYLELSVYLPEALRALEMPIRERLRQRLKRGKVECVVRYQVGVNHEQTAVAVNAVLARAVCEAAAQIGLLLTKPALINPVDILRFPGVIETKDSDMSTMHGEVFHLVDVAIRDLVAARAREGEELKQLFFQRLDLIQNQLQVIRERLPQVMEEQLQRLRKRFAEVSLILESGRLEQEMVLFAQKMDVAEEVERTETHITEVRRTLDEGGVIGRRLDFLSQELNREANTLGSKSMDAVLTHAAVEMKVLIEQIREQVQNVE